MMCPTQLHRKTSTLAYSSGLLTAVVRCKRSVMIMLLLSLHLAALPGSSAQPFWSSPGEPACPDHHGIKKLHNTSNPEFHSEHLKKPVDLQDMPAYAGKKPQFVGGTLFPNVKGGASVTMQLSVHESPKDVLRWYQDQFAANNWTPLQNMVGANGLAAMKQHNICQVMTLAPSRAGCKCDVLLRFKFYKPTAIQ